MTNTKGTHPIPVDNWILVHIVRWPADDPAKNERQIVSVEQEWRQLQDNLSVIFASKCDPEVSMRATRGCGAVVKRNSLQRGLRNIATIALSILNNFCLCKFIQRHFQVRDRFAAYRLQRGKMYATIGCRG